jgi:serine/threonine protein kinase
MEHERVERVKQLLATALARPPGERDAYLDAACDGDLLLRQDVQRYLQSGDRTERFQFHSDPTQPSIPHESAPVGAETVDVPADPRVGKEFGKYVIQRRVAEGGMGIVYLAVDSQLGREVALKIIPEYFSMDTERLQRFRREARATSLLNHPNIVTVFEVGQMDGCEFIASEYVDGETLRDKIIRGPIPFVEMLKIASQVAGALGAAHKAGIIHRDIKPENVMIRPDGYVKVLDFGLAKMTMPIGQSVSGGGTSLHNHTIPGMILGTAAYMSPEQAEGTDVDARTDIWGLGVLLYEMAAGKQPFQGPTPSHTIVAILEHEPQPYEHPSPELRQIITTALQKDRTLRFQSAEAMSAALDELKHRLGYFSDQNIAGPTTDDRKALVAKPSPYRKLAWIVPVAAIVLLAGVVGIYALMNLVLSGALSANSNSANNAVPSPTSTVESNTAVVVPTPTAELSTPAPVYVEPTPEPTPEPTAAVPVSTPTPVRERPVIVPTPRPTRQPTPRRTPKPKQDPNCVFTNSCN